MIRFGDWDNERLILANNRLNGEARFVDRSSDTVITLADHDTLCFDTASKVVTQIQASGFFTVANLRSDAPITLQQNDAKIRTLSGADLVLGVPSQVAGFVVVNPKGDVVRQIF